MGTIQIKKVERTVTTGKTGETRQKVQKTYGKIIYRGTLNLADMAEHIMKHGTVYTEDVVIGVITKMKNCIQEMLADGYKVKTSPAWASPSWPTRARSRSTRLRPPETPPR